MLTSREREALDAMIGIAEADTEEWERNLPDDDHDPSVEDSEAADLAARRVTIAEARAVLARAPLAGPEVRAFWHNVPGEPISHSRWEFRAAIESLPLDQITPEMRAPDGYAVYVEGPPATPQLHLCDCPTLEAARTIAELIALADAGDPIVGYAAASLPEELRCVTCGGVISGEAYAAGPRHLNTSDCSLIMQRKAR